MQENSQNIVNLGEIDPEVTEDVLTFIYTGQIELTTENAVAILKAADFLLLETLKSPVDSFLASMCQHISANPLRSYGIALDYKSPLFKTTALDLVCADFLDVIKSNEFLEISTETIQEIFSSDDLLVNSEEEVFHALLKWVKHNPGDREPLFPTLFPLIRSLSEEFLKSVVFSEQLVFAQPKCLGHVLDCITNEPRPRDCLDREDAVLFLPKNGDSKPFCFHHLEMKELSVLNGGVLSCCEATYYAGSIYLVKPVKTNGEDTSQLQVTAFNTRTSLWSNVSSLQITPFCQTTSQSIVCVKGAVYLIGGLSGQRKSPSGLVYSCDIHGESQFSECASMLTALDKAVVVCDEQHIYVLGGEGVGSDGRIVHIGSLQQFDPETNSWKLLFPSIRAIPNKNNCIFRENKLFMFTEKSCVIYDIKTKSVRHAPFTSEGGVIICINNIAYLLSPWNMHTFNLETFEFKKKPPPKNIQNHSSVVGGLINEYYISLLVPLPKKTIKSWTA